MLLDIDARDARALDIEINQGPHRGSIRLVWARLIGNNGQLALQRGDAFPLTADFTPDGFADTARVGFRLNDNRFRARLLVDRNSLEVFPGTGNATLSALFYPHPDNDGLRISAVGGEARINALDAAREAAREKALEAAKEREAAKKAAREKARERVKIRQAVQQWLRDNLGRTAAPVWSDGGRPVYSITAQRSGWLVKVPVQVGKGRQSWTFAVDRGFRVTSASADDPARLKRRLKR